MKTTDLALTLFPGSPVPGHRSRLYAGVDEAGRGPLAGPVAVAAVVFDPARPRINGLDDSKQLTAARRETLYARIVERALAWQVVLIDANEIDRLNIYQATMLGMRRAVEGVAHVAGFARIDGNRVPKGLPCAAEALVGGDGLDRAIMAASIVAKVTRDRIMQQLHAQHPHYGFDLHKGYATPAHLAALAAHGPCAQHRRSFAPVRAASRDRGPGTGDPEQQQIARLPGPI
ncbi:ribonuclease HII [Xanthomonas graminis]|jgi:ribonuclease HII|uniref:ribonuclease HII n=1 Tax=Xanthomonas graminis TaxID=3390026 RepID=UPI00029CABF3|nr:ribonuclease HII [Xanthomonas translucens]EKU24934.1 Ribonuclease HII [Xanthomonas translucens pv. graminis ART-Xtg29]OAX58858.1 ribonuclease HII [Xanthomonas translucens pv. graminis]UKE55685.1 ribonuclease HII [Xanthomonas translucens pv. graminis]WIH13460.1 ribonuclease HII [Xanthomonas translucens pv. graminis]WIH14860.1 ribonuclease HII [Xanthomonas translucens pv. graminis]